MRPMIFIFVLSILCLLSGISHANRSLPIVGNISCRNFINQLNYDFERYNYNVSLTSSKYDANLSTPQLVAYTSRTPSYVSINFYTRGNDIYRISAIFEIENTLMTEEAIKVLSVSCIEAGMNNEELDELFHWDSTGSDIAESRIFSRKLNRRIDSVVITNDNLACLSIMAFDY